MDVHLYEEDKMIEQRTEKWFVLRRGRVTASLVGAILNLSPNQKRKDVMRAMVREWHNAEKEFKGNSATEYGTFHEDMAKLDFQMETGSTIEDTGFHPFDVWLGASPDGFVDDHLIEIKCPFSLRNATEPAFKTIAEQPHYYAQIQIQLFVTRRKTCIFYQWSPFTSSTEMVDYDDAWITENLPKLLAFYEEYLTERFENSAVHLAPKHAAVDGLDDKVKYYFEIKAQIASLEELAKTTLQEIVNGCDNKDSEIDGHKLTKVVKKGSVSYAKAIKELLPNADLTAFTGEPTEYWKLS